MRGNVARDMLLNRHSLAMRLAICGLLEKRMPYVASEYRLLAEQCKRLVSQAEDEQYRLLLIRVAAKLSELADQAEVEKNSRQKSQRKEITTTDTATLENLPSYQRRSTT
jgi:phosphoenolpyruvate carboxylase